MRKNPESVRVVCASSDSMSAAALISAVCATAGSWSETSSNEEQSLCPIVSRPPPLYHLFAASLVVGGTILNPSDLIIWSRMMTAIPVLPSSGLSIFVTTPSTKTVIVAASIGFVFSLATLQKKTVLMFFSAFPCLCQQLFNIINIQRERTSIQLPVNHAAYVSSIVVSQLSLR